MPNINDVHKQILKEVENIREEMSLPDNPRAFQAWCLHFAHSLPCDEAVDKSDTLSQGDGGIDGWHKDEVGRTFYLWQCKWSEEPKTTDQTPAIELINALDVLKQEATPKNWPGKFQDIHTQLHSAINAGCSVTLCVGVSGQVSDAAKKKILNQLELRSYDYPVDIEFWELGHIHDVRIQRHPSSETLVGKNVKFTLQSPSVIQENGDGGVVPTGWQACVASLNAKSLGNIAAEHGNRLFSLNVRYALNLNKRLKSLVATLESEEDAEKFWLYNNGITILCEEFSIDDKGEYLSIKNPQIVNGCQTTTQISKLRASLKDNVSVLSRVIAIPDTQVSDEAAMIAHTSNSQNPVDYKDLHSNDPIQKSLKIKFDGLSKPYFYETKRGEWGPQKRSVKSRYKKEGGGHRKIEISELGQAWWIFNSSPSTAITQKKQLFEDDLTYANVFSEDIPVEYYLAAILLRERYTEVWSAAKRAKLKQTFGRWLKDDVVNYFMRAKGQVISHSVALTSRFLVKEDGGWEPVEITKLITKLADHATFVNEFEDWNKQLVGMAFKNLYVSAKAHYEGKEAPLDFKKWLERDSELSLEFLVEEIEDQIDFQGLGKSDYFKFL